MSLGTKMIDLQSLTARRGGCDCVLLISLACCSPHECFRYLYPYVCPNRLFVVLLTPPSFTLPPGLL